MTAPSSLLLKDLAHRTVLPVWNGESTGLAGMAGIGDILLIPDPDRFHILPWLRGHRLASGRYLSHRWQPLSSRHARHRKACKCRPCRGRPAVHAGLEIEAHVYRLTDGPLNASDIGQPGTPPEVEILNRGYQLLTEHYADTLEPVMTLIHETCASLAIPIRSLEVEFGPSQIEFTCAARPGSQPRMTWCSFVLRFAKRWRATAITSASCADRRSTAALLAAGIFTSRLRTAAARTCSRRLRTAR